MSAVSILMATRSPRTLYLAMCLLWTCWPVAAQPASPEGQVSADPLSQDGRGLMTLNFQNIDIRALLQVMADFTGLNLVVSDSVTGTVTLRLKEVPWAHALNIILEAHGLGMRQIGNVLQIAPKTELAAREKNEIEAQQTLQGLGPVRMQQFKLNYARAADVARSLTGSGTGAGTGANAPGGMRILSARGSVLADLRTNQVFVSDMPTRLVQVQDLIRKLDIPVRQVLIEARIVEASDNFGRSLGVRMGGRGTSLNNNINTQAGASYLSPDAAAAPAQPPTFGVTSGDFVNLPAAAQNGYNAASFAVSLFNASLTRVLNLEISAMEADGKGKIISSPRIVTTDQVKALIEQGTELPYEEKSASGATTTTFRKANLKLEVTPQITPEGNIILNLDINKDSVGRLTAKGFAIDTKHVQTQVLVENGGTVSIGGIFEETERTDDTKVPVLGDLPGLGWLFRNRNRSRSKSEMMVFITPKLLDQAATGP
jgi:type IV pilus assembly protein PilQ